MTSRLNQLNKRIAPQRRGIHSHATSLRNRVPSTSVPRATLGQPYQGQPTPPHEPELSKRVHGVLTARRREAARGWSQRRDHRAVQLDDIDDAESDGPAQPAAAHRRAPLFASKRCSAVRSSCSSRAEIAWRLLGKARITTLSPGSRSSITSRVTCRKIRETRFRCTAL